MSVIDGQSVSGNREDEFDVVVIGSGAGGGTAAEILATQGLRVAVLEMGPYRRKEDFNLHERDAYPQLYQDAAARKTADKSIAIYQGRCVGGGTTVNWTTSFRTPATTLTHWKERWGLDFGDLTHRFEGIEKRLGIAPWEVPPNPNNRTLARGAAKLGIATGVIRRNVRGCANLGYCGLGCPLDAKQSMLVTTIPAALAAGATLYSQFEAWRLHRQGLAASHLEARARGGGTLTLRARHFVLAAGALGTPALLLRSEWPDPHGHIGRRTFLHPVGASAAIMPGVIDGHAGAPQVIYSDHFNEPASDRPGYKLEVPPLYPMLTAVTLPGMGQELERLMGSYRRLQAIIALQRDGFHPESPGGQVTLRRDGSPRLRYEMTPYQWRGIRHAAATMAEIQLAAGAREVLLGHEEAEPARTRRELHRQIERLPWAPGRAKLVSAHAMGGCAMSLDPREGVTNADGHLHQGDNVTVVDGSLFPTSLGANPQLSIYAFAGRSAERLARRLRDPMAFRR